MASAFTRWAPNIAVKLPATAAGLDVLEDCIADGITATATVSFTVPQALAIAERHRAGVSRARAQNGISPGRCFAVIMIGRLDDYLREVAHDRQRAAQRSRTSARPGSQSRSGRIPCIKAAAMRRSLLVAALRGSYHLDRACGRSIS